MEFGKNRGPYSDRKSPYITHYPSASCKLGTEIEKFNNHFLFYRKAQATWLSLITMDAWRWLFLLTIGQVIAFYPRDSHHHHHHQQQHPHRTRKITAGWSNVIHLSRPAFLEKMRASVQTSYCIVLYLFIYIAPLTALHQSVAIPVRETPRK